MNQGYWSGILHNRLSRRRALAGAATLGATALAAAACGGDDDNKTSRRPRRTSPGLLYQPVDTTKQAVKGGIAVFPGGTEGQGFDPNIGDDRVQAQTQHAYQRLLSWKLGSADDLPTGEVIGGAAQS